jgi:hypothetical protein
VGRGFLLASGLHVDECASDGAIAAPTAVRQPSALAELLPDAPRAFVAVVDRALALDRADRFPSAAAMREALREASVIAFGGIAPLPSDLSPGAVGRATPDETAVESTAPPVPLKASSASLAVRWRRPLLVAAGVAVAMGFFLMRQLL